MKKTDYRCFYKTSFLDSDTHDDIFKSKELLWESGFLIDEDGTYTETKEDKILKNEYKNSNTIVLDYLPSSLQTIVSKVKDELIKNGAVDPVLFHAATMTNPNPDPMSRDFKWHKDYNSVYHASDETKVWIVMVVFGDESINSRLKVSPTPDGPELWNIGFDLELEPNLMLAHTINLGHEYIKNDKNNLNLLHMRWYEANYSTSE